jgi:hypothetical protein
MTTSRAEISEREQLIAEVEQYLKKHFPASSDPVVLAEVTRWWLRPELKKTHAQLVERLTEQAHYGLGAVDPFPWGHVPTILEVLSEQDQLQEVKLLSLKNRVQIMLTAVTVDYQLAKRARDQLVQATYAKFGKDTPKAQKKLSSHQTVKEYTLLRQHKETLKEFLKALCGMPLHVSTNNQELR